MQINLIPKTREQAEKKKQVNSIILTLSLFIIIATGVFTAVVYGINLNKKSIVKNDDNKITTLRSDIDKYKDVEDSVTTLVKNIDDAKAILDTRKDLTFAYRNLQILFPREARMKDLVLSSTQATFDIEAGSYSKIAETIKSLEDYKVQLLLEETTPSDKDTLVKPETSTESEKVKMFTSVNVSKFTHSTENQIAIYRVSVTADISEDIWQTIK